MPMYLPTSGLPPALLFLSDHCFSQTLPPAHCTLVSVPKFDFCTNMHFSHGAYAQTGHPTSEHHRCVRVMRIVELSCV